MNLFELVSGEMDMLLGELTDERELEDRIFDIYADSHVKPTGRHGAQRATAGDDETGEESASAGGVPRPPAAASCSDQHSAGSTRYQPNASHVVPSSEHEVLADLFQQRPALAGELLAMLGALPRRALSAELLGTARLDSESFRQLEPAQYATDKVVLFGGRARPDFRVVVEVQRGRACRDVDTLNRWIDRAALVPSAEALLE